MNSQRVGALGVAAVMMLLGALPASAGLVPVDLNTWTEESLGGASWNVAGTGNSVLQTVNGEPTFFYSDFNAIGTELRGAIEVTTSSDDDFIGFALGFNPGDASSATADYLLIDWKQTDQYWAPYGGTGFDGLALSRVTGALTEQDAWLHTGSVTELARGTNLGSTGWDDHTSYDFRFTFQTDLVEVYVNDVLEMSVAGSFNNGRIAFYNFSQAFVDYSALELDDEVPPTSQPPVPEPASMTLLGLGVAGLAARKMRRK